MGWGGKYPTYDFQCPDNTCTGGAVNSFTVGTSMLSPHWVSPVRAAAVLFFSIDPKASNTKRYSEKAFFFFLINLDTINTSEKVHP